MSKPPSDDPPEEPGQTIPPSKNNANHLEPAFFPFGLSADQFAHVTRAMMKVARSVCRHSSASAGDAVQQAFVKALSKPETERPSIQNQKKFVAWICKLAKYEALTNRQYRLRQAQREVSSDLDLPELLSVSHSFEAVEARKMLEHAFLALAPDEQALLNAIYAEGRTVDDVATEQGLTRTTVDSRRKRLLNLLYAAIQAKVMALVLAWPKKARAFAAHGKQQAAQMLISTAHLGAAMTVTAMCGVLVPTSSSAMTHPMPLCLTENNIEQATTADVAVTEPSVVPKVEPEEPKDLDPATNQCSAADMKSLKIARYLQETVVPLAFVVAPALTQPACAGTAQGPSSAQQPEEEYDGTADPYEVMCLQERMRGASCPTREEWLKEIGAK
jgi:RNA polymerase sigma factor (sigma-70 family)